MAPQNPIPITIRSFEPADSAQCKKLYVEGLLGGHLAENDTGVDIDDIQSTYMKTPGNHFWVAISDGGELLGMIGVQRDEPGTCAIRRLRVRQDSQRRGIGTKLIETALKFCQDQGYLKVMLDTFIRHEPALKLFEKFNFRHTRSRTVGDRELRYYYLDLYTRDSGSERQE